MLSIGLGPHKVGKLWRPRKVAVIPDSGRFVVCDNSRGNSRLQLFDSGGRFLKKLDTVECKARTIVGLEIAPPGMYYNHTMLAIFVHTSDTTGSKEVVDCVTAETNNVPEKYHIVLY